MTKRAMVTGASSGIGLEFAKALAGAGYELVLVARSRPKLEELAKSLGGDTHKVEVADLSKPADINRIAALLKSQKMDVLVNNAGVGIYGTFHQLPLEQQLSMQRLNCDAVTVLAYAFLEKATKGDALINVASTLGLLAYPGAALYAATKAFVVSLSESLWYEQLPRGVYVMALCPGITKTNFHEGAGGNEASRPPSGITQTPVEVVQAAMRGLESRSSPTVVSGAKNEMMIFGTRFMSRKAVIKMMGGFSSKNTSLSS